MTVAPLRLTVALAAVMGAAGIAIAALAAHGGDPSRLGPASSILLFHASAILATLALAERHAIHPFVGSVAAAGFLIGAALFSGDLMVRHFTGNALFPMAAPLGGTLLIASWLALVVAALMPRRA